MFYSLRAPATQQSADQMFVSLQLHDVFSFNVKPLQTQQSGDMCTY